jgi:hypothetical protein
MEGWVLQNQQQQDEQWEHQQNAEQQHIAWHRRQ